MLFFRIGMSPGISVYWAMICLYRQDASVLTKRLEFYQVIWYRWQVQMNPREQCKSVIESRMKSFRCSWVAMSKKTCTALINMVVIYSKPSLESQTAAQQLLVTNNCCWMAGRSWLFLCIRNFISLNNVPLFATALSLWIPSLGKINRWYQNVQAVSVCMCRSGKWESFCNS